MRTTAVAQPNAAPPSPPRLESTELPDVYRLQSGAELGIDLANLKGQRVRDGLLSFHDAEARGIAREAWLAATRSAKDDTARLQALRDLFARAAPPQIKLRALDGASVDVDPARAAALQAALAQLRAEVHTAHAAGKQVAYPVRRRAGWIAVTPRRARAAHVIDPKALTKSLGLSASEAGWLFGELAAKTERVPLPDGRAHYMTPALRRTLDANVAEMYASIDKARAQGKRIAYMSTFISAVDPAINRAIARFIETRMAHDALWSNTFVIDPATRQSIPGALGDDYMYMWTKLLRLNVFDVVRFTSAADTKAWFEHRQQPVPAKYAFVYGDVLHSAGCRYEWNLFAAINRDTVAQGQPHLMVPFYYGDEPVPMPMLTQMVDTMTYEKRGELPG